MLICLATAADIPELMALEQDAPTAAHWSEGNYRAAFSADAARRIILVAKEDVIRGFLAGRSLGKEWEIENLVVANATRRRGLATWLVLEFMRVAASEGGEDIFLEVRESNLAARTLYDKLQFADTGRRPSYYVNPVEDAVLYQRKSR